MKIVKEYINEFEQGGDPYKTLDIGKNTYVAKEKLYKKLEDKGVHFWLSFSGFTQEERRDYFINCIHEIEYFINKLIGIGLDYTDIRVTDEIRYDISSYLIYNGNTSIGICLTEEDAINFINSMKAFVLETRRLTYEKQSRSSVGNAIYMNKESEQMLDNLLANRKKYKNIK